MHPKKITKVTFAQDKFNGSTDYINEAEGIMIADYYKDGTTPLPFNDNPTADYSINISCSGSQTIKVGGGYKTLTAKFIDIDGNIIPDHYAEWKFLIDGVEIDTNKKDILTVSYPDELDTNIVKIKLAKDDNLSEKTITCTAIDYDNNSCSSSIELGAIIL